MNTIKHIWWAIRYGEWYMGTDTYDGQPRFGFESGYYDGNYASFHVYKFYIAVFY